MGQKQYGGRKGLNTAAHCIALGCVAREVEALSASLYLSPSNAMCSRNGNGHHWISWKSVFSLSQR